MKIINPFTILYNKIIDNRRKDVIRETEETVNSKIYVSNDPKDPNNKIYIFCNGIPVIEIADDSIITNTTVNINDAAEVLERIKAMYRNHLNNKPIK